MSSPTHNKDLSDDDSKLFVGNITYNTRERELETIFSKYGRVKEVRVAMDKATGRSRGYAFITMEDPRDAQDAVREVTGMNVDGRSIRVEVSHGTRPGDSGRGKDRGYDRDRDRDYGGGRDRDRDYGRDRDRDRDPDRSRGRGDRRDRDGDSRGGDRGGQSSSGRGDRDRERERERDRRDRSRDRY